MPLSLRNPLDQGPALLQKARDRQGEKKFLSCHRVAYSESVPGAAVNELAALHPYSIMNPMGSELAAEFMRRMARRGRYPRPITQTELTAFQVWVALWLASIAPGVAAAAPPPGPPVRNALLDTIDHLDAMMDIYERVDLLVWWSSRLNRNA